MSTKVPDRARFDQVASAGDDCVAEWRAPGRDDLVQATDATPFVRVVPEFEQGGEHLGALLAHRVRYETVSGDKAPLGMRGAQPHDITHGNRVTRRGDIVMRGGHRRGGGRRLGRALGPAAHCR